MKKRLLSALLCAAMITLSLSGCAGANIDLPFFGPGRTEREIIPLGTEAEENVLRAAVLYDGAQGGGAWEDTYSRLSQPLLLSFEAEAVDISAEGWSLEGYDLVYPDESVMTAEGSDALRDAVTDYVRQGGSAFLTGGFHDFFPRDLLGARRFEELESCPESLSYPELGPDLTELQDLVRDFYSLYTGYGDFDAIASYSGGFALVPSTADALALCGEGAVASVNQYGSGYVYYGCLLPCFYSVTGTELVSRDETQVRLSDTTMSFDRLMECSFAAFVAKKTWGCALWRVFGSFGSPAMSWEMSIEDSAAVESGAALSFADQCRDRGQIASFSVARNIYTAGLRAESVTYLLGKSRSAMTFELDAVEGVYSSGTHISAGGEWLSLAALTDSGSYFDRGLSFPERACPWVSDLDGDGLPDIICGSSDGLFHVFTGTEYRDRVTTLAPEVLLGADGSALSVGSFSAPVVCDVDGDGEDDLVSGAGDGKIYWFSGEGGEFAYRGVLLDTGLGCQTLPDIGDLDGDGLADLVVGTNAGKLLLYAGTVSGTGFSRRAQVLDTFGVSGDWLSPRIWQLDSDGVADIAVGTADGYVARLLGVSGGGFASGGFIETDEMNTDGSYRAKFGSKATPFFADVNGDGITDLICGCLEYGLAYPMTERLSPVYSQLYSQVRRLSAEGYYLGLHLFTGEFASSRREHEELVRHLGAMQSFGAAYGYVGASRHTQYMSTLDFSQTFLSAWDEGMLWYCGAPDGGENAFSIPWYLTVDGERTILLQNRVDPDFSSGGVLELGADYALPLLVACDAGTPEADIGRTLDHASSFAVENGYSFCMEDQLMLATAAAYNLRADITGASADTLDITISANSLTNRFPLYSGVYSTCCGARLSLGEALAGKALTVDADVWRWDGDDLYIGLDRTVRIYDTGAAQTGSHLSGVNVAAMISAGGGRATVKFTDGGLLQATVQGSASTSTPGWRTVESGGFVTFTRYGADATLIIDFAD